MDLIIPIIFNSYEKRSIVTLISLDISHNPLALKGESVIAEGVRYNPVLSKLMIAARSEINHSPYNNQPNLEEILQTLIGNDAAYLLSAMFQMKFPVVEIY
jgi:hypothetical protein